MRKLVDISVTSALALCISWGCGSTSSDPNGTTGGNTHAGGNNDSGSPSEHGGSGNVRASGGIGQGGHDQGGVAGAGGETSGGSPGGGQGGAGGNGGDAVGTGGIIGAGGMSSGGTSTGETTGGVSTGGAAGGIASGGISTGGTSTGGASIGGDTGGSSGGVSTGGATGGSSTGGTGTGGVSTGGATGGTTGGSSGGVSTGGATGGSSTGGNTGGDSTGGTTGGSSGGVSTGGATGGSSNGGTGTGGAPSCANGTHACGALCVADGAPGIEFVHAVYGCGHRFAPATGSGDWVSFESGLNVDEKTGYGWYQPSGSHTQAEGIAICTASAIAGINSGWTLPTIDQARTLAAGCADTAPGGTCGISDPSCLLNTCAAGTACESCIGSAGPNAGRYCRENVRLCTNVMSSSVCPNCTGPATVWMYGVLNGSFVLVSSGSRYTHLCVRPSVPNY